jgi:hypothetical protein
VCAVDDLLVGLGAARVASDDLVAIEDDDLVVATEYPHRPPGVLRRS